MKFWQLTSFLRDTPSHIIEASFSRPEWQVFGEWVKREEQLIDKQDRETLDTELPDEFVIAVLSRVQTPLFTDAEGWLRRFPERNDDRRLTAVEAFELYGGAVLEDVIEKGVSHRKMFGDAR